MGLLKSVATIVSTPVRCLGEIGKDLSTLSGDGDETDGMLCVFTLSASSVVKGVVKSLKQAGKDFDE